MEAEKQGEKDLALGTNLTRLTAKALMYLVLTTSKTSHQHHNIHISNSASNSNESSSVATPTSNSSMVKSTPTAKSALRRAAIDIIGRGFVLWEPHLEVSKVTNTLIELLFHYL